MLRVHSRHTVHIQTVAGVLVCSGISHIKKKIKQKKLSHAAKLQESSCTASLLLYTCVCVCVCNEKTCIGVTLTSVIVHHVSDTQHVPFCPHLLHQRPDILPGVALPLGAEVWTEGELVC